MMTNSRSLLVAGAVMCASSAVVSVDVHGLTLSKRSSWAGFFLINNSNTYRQQRRRQQLREADELLEEANVKRASEMAAIIDLRTSEEARKNVRASEKLRKKFGLVVAADNEGVSVAHGKLVDNNDNGALTDADSSPRPADVGLPTRLNFDVLDSPLSEEQEQRMAFDEGSLTHDFRDDVIRVQRPGAWDPEALRNHLRQGDSRAFGGRPGLESQLCKSMANSFRRFTGSSEGKENAVPQGSSEDATTK